MLRNKSIKINNSSKPLITLVVLIIALVLTFLASIALGARSLALTEVWNGLFNSGVFDKSSLIPAIVQARIPRTVFGICVGAALGVSGALMQSVTRNPISDPSILGVNSGAALFVVIGMSFFNLTSLMVNIWLAILGSLLTALFVYAIGSMGKGGATPIKLVLAGVAVTAALSSLTSAILMPRGFVMDEFRFWQVGSIGNGTWETVKAFLPFLGAGLLIGVLTAPSLNALALGDEAAKGLGVRVGRLRIIASIGAVLLCGAATAIAGPISFLGLLAPHLVRLFIGPNFRYVIPFSALTGAIILLFSDILGRLLGGVGELEVGIVTAFVGAPLLIVLAIKSKIKTI